MTPAPRTREGLIRQLVFDNLGLKIVSLLASLALFLMVRGAEDGQRSVFVEVIAVIPDASSGRILLSDIPDRVRVTLRGSRVVLNSIGRDDIPPIQVNLEDTQGRLFYFDPDRIEVPAGVEITQVAPATIQLQWADRSERVLPVEATLEGRLGPGLMMNAPQVRPPTVSISGPAPEIIALDHITTDPISLVGLDPGRHERRVGLMRLPPHAEYREDTTAVVTFDVYPEMAERVLPRLDVAVVGGEARELRPSRVRVHLRGPPARLDAIDLPQIVPYIEIGNLPHVPGAQPVAVQVRGVPEGIELSAIEPEEVLVSVVRPSSQD